MPRVNQTDNQRFYLLGASFATNNMGVNALTAGIIECIVHNNPSAEITLIDYGKEETTYPFQTGNKIIPVHLLNIRFSKKIYLKNNVGLLILLSLLIKIIPIKNLKANLISKNSCLDKISKADVIASIAGGDSFSDIYGLERLLYVSLPQLLVISMGKRLILLPQTIGPFKGKVAKFLGKYILDHASTVYSRDYNGLNDAKLLMESEGHPEKVRFCYDVGFVVNSIAPSNNELIHSIEKIKEHSCVVGLNVSGLIYMGGYTQKNMFGLKLNYRDFIYNLIDHLIKKMNVAVFLIPHVFGSSTNPESDSAVSEVIYEELVLKYQKRLSMAKGVYNQSEIKYIIGLCDFFIGSRMHACIAALSQCIPTIGIAYSDKFRGVFETIGMDELIVDPRAMGEMEIFEVLENKYNEKNKIKDRLDVTIPGVRAAIFKIFQDILNEKPEEPNRSHL